MNEPTHTNPDHDRLLAALPAEIAARVKSARIVGERAIIVVDASDIAASEHGEFEQLITQKLTGFDSVKETRVAFMADRKVRRSIAIGSGKGGVGKSTLTANLAAALHGMGHKVGVVDGDIYGPSQAKLLATEGQKPRAENDKLIPIISPGGVPVLSMAHLAKPAQALAWRGPMVGNAFSQLVDAEWGDVDLLLLDLPPGTGDVQISMLQKHKPDGAILVSTPQDLALIDAARAGQLFENGDVPIIGLVENMAGYACPHCGETSDPFGNGGFENMARTLEIPFLGRIPLTIAIREAGDHGAPPAAGDSEEGAAFRAVAQGVDRWIAQMERHNAQA